MIAETLLLLIASCLPTQAAPQPARSAPASAGSPAVEAIARAALKSNSMEGLNGTLSFRAILEPRPVQPAQAGSIYEQDWRIVVADGGRYLRADVTWFSENRETARSSFGETADAIWWTMSDSLCVYEKNSIEKHRQSEQKASIEAAEQLLSQARSQLRTILGARGLGGKQDAVELVASRRGAGSGEGEVLARINHEGQDFELLIESAGRHSVISRIAHERRGSLIEWTYGDFQAVEDRMVPGWVQYRSTNPDRGGESTLYSNVTYLPAARPDEARRLVTIPDGFNSHLPQEVVTRITYDDHAEPSSRDWAR